MKIVVISKLDNTVVHEVDVTNKSVGAINTIEDGMNRNLNHDNFYTKVVLNND